ncbi:unnamed protein product [marine sediment metagenome]|uniref:CHAT domain-containing protein n=1 Tax=marine sediment metagenome TaxID=412755 RepID=X1KFD3_9ZZZZ
MIIPYTKALLVRPRFDEPTQHSFAFAGEILQWCRQAKPLIVDVIELAEGEAIRARVEQELTPDVDLFIFYDHGDEDALIGQDEKPVIDLENAGLLAGKEVFTLACLSAKDLGPAVWRQGGTYWGYVDVFSFTTDSLAEFQEAANCGFKFRFIEGDTRQNSLQRAKETFTRLALELVDAGKVFAAICMREDGDTLVYLDAHKPEEKEGCLLALLKLPVSLLRR